jgi:electron transport complex protein RnfG
VAPQVTNLTDGQQSVWSAGVILAVIAAICTTLVALTYTLTKARITANEQAWLEQSLTPALSGLEYDNNLIESVKTISMPEDLPGNEEVEVYRARIGNRPVAAMFVVTAVDGFSGPIRLLVGIDAQGIITGARVLQHRETPGLGDFIDSSKSDWIDQFADKSLAAPDVASWSLRRDGGEFDQVTGASITSRAVVKAVRETLLYFDANRDHVFE